MKIAAMGRRQAPGASVVLFRVVIAFIVFSR
jgi:hypothetical protein